MTKKAQLQKDAKHDVMRKCIATGELHPKSELLRFVIGPDNTVVFDVASKLPGRGIWVSSTRPALEQATKKNGFARSAKTNARIPEALIETVEGILVQRLLSLISLSRKSGNAVCGATKVKDWLSQDCVAALFQASDGSEREQSKFRLYGQGQKFTCLSKAELGEAFGRDFAAHVALDAGGLTARVIEEATRLTGFRPEAPLKRKKG